METRVGDLFGSKRLAGFANPIGPEAVFTAIKRACAAASGEQEIKAVLSHALHPMLADALTSLFREINELLKSEGVLPHLRFEIERPPGEAAFPFAKPRLTQSTRIDHAIEKTQDRSAAKFNDGESARLTRLADVLNSAEAAAQHGPVDIARLVTAVLSGPPGAVTLGAGLQGDRHSALYRQAIKLSVAAPLTEALTKMQSKMPLDSNGSPRTHSADELVAYLDQVDQLYKHPIDVLTGQLIAAVYRHILEDDQLATPVKRELARLQIVALKAALLDRTFFAREEHPFRRMMSQITRLSVDPQFDLRTDGPFEKILHDTVEGLLARFESDLMIFDVALERFAEAIEKHANPSESSIATLAETPVANEFVALATGDAAQQISQRIAPKTPAYIETFLKETWVPLLAAADVNGLPDEDNYAARMEAAEQLVWSVTPMQPTELPKLITILPGLIRALRRGMRAANASLQQEEEFLANLMTSHTNLMQGRRRQPDSSELRGSRIAYDVSRHADTNVDRYPLVLPPSDNATVVIAMPFLKRGQIVEFLEEVSVVRRTLVWVSPRNSHYVFSSDQFGPRSLTSLQLAEAIRIGRVVPVSDQASIVDRAVTSVTYIKQAA